VHHSAVLRAHPPVLVGARHCLHHWWPCWFSLCRFSLSLVRASALSLLIYLPVLISLSPSLAASLVLALSPPPPPLSCTCAHACSLSLSVDLPTCMYPYVSFISGLAGSHFPFSLTRAHALSLLIYVSHVCHCLHQRHPRCSSLSLSPFLFPCLPPPPSPLNTGQVCLGSKVLGVEFVESRKSRVESVMSRLNVSCVV